MKNPDLEAVHRMLVGYVVALGKAQESATSPEAIKAIGREIDEVGNRATLAGQLLFKAKSEKITAAAAQVAAAKEELDDAIAEIEKLNRFLKTIAKFLGLVDKLLDLAKLGV